MADVATAIRKHLLTKSAITDLVSTRIYAGVLPTKPTLPALTMQVVEHEHERHLTGASGVAHATIRFEAYDWDTLDARKSTGIAEQLRLYMLDPTIWHVTVQGVWVEHIVLLSGPFEIISPPRDASQKYRFRNIMDFRVSYHEATEIGT